MDENQPVQQPSVVISNPETKPEKSRKFHLAIDYRLIIVGLLLIIAVMLALWRPWNRSPSTSSRTISVTGDATIQATPDEYVFTPSYTYTNAVAQTALNQLSAQSSTITTKLEALGVTSSQIQTDASGAEPYYNYVVNDDGTTTYTLQLTVTVESKSLAQKVQDYLITTSPSGSVSPNADFSNAQQQSLNNQARNEATKDARAKAEQTAQNLGFKLGAVKSVTDEGDSGQSSPLENSVNSGTSFDSAQPSLSVQPGQNSLQYSVDVVYYIH